MADHDHARIANIDILAETIHDVFMAWVASNGEPDTDWCREWGRSHDVARRPARAIAQGLLATTVPNALRTAYNMKSAALDRALDCLNAVQRSTSTSKHTKGRITNALADIRRIEKGG